MSVPLQGCLAFPRYLEFSSVSLRQKKRAFQSSISAMTVFLTSLFQMVRHFWDRNRGAGKRVKVTNRVFPLPSLSLRLTSFAETVNKISKISIFSQVFFMTDLDCSAIPELFLTLK